jgi:uncharacterized membrane protein
MTIISTSPIAKIFNQGYLYRFILFLCALTGFGQMPIYKRYYMADIPGFGWLADFYVTRLVHYVGAALLLGLLAFALTDYLLRRRTLGAPTWSALARGALLAVIVLSGLFFVAKNLAGAYYPPAAVIVGNLIHLGAVMGLLALSLYCLLFRKGWLDVDMDTAPMKKG